MDESTPLSNGKHQLHRNHFSRDRRLFLAAIFSLFGVAFFLGRFEYIIAFDKTFDGKSLLSPKTGTGSQGDGDNLFRTTTSLRLNDLEKEVSTLRDQYEKMKSVQNMIAGLLNDSPVVKTDHINLKTVDELVQSEDPCFVDPLDDRCENGLENFDIENTGGLTPETGRICDVDYSVMLPKNDEFRCETDPTCIQCRKKDISLTQRLYDSFNHPSIVEKRMRRVNELFLSHKNSTSPHPIIVCSVNLGQVYLFLNWACSCLKTGSFDPRLHTYIIPSDEGAYEVLYKHGFFAEPTDWMKLPGAPEISAEYTGGANVGGHSMINNLLAFATNFFVQNDYHVILMDVDLIFLHNPVPFLMQAGKSRDILGMFSPRDDQYGFMNSGFLFLRPTKKSKFLMQSFENLCFVKHKSDQQLWNTVLRSNALNQLEQRILPREYYFTLWKSLEKYGYDAERTFVVHAVSVDKAKRFIDMGKWFFTESCPVFDVEIDQLSRSNNLYGEMQD